MLLVSGCTSNSGDTIALPPYDAEALAAAAIKHLDKNGNGTIEETEATESPALKQIFMEVDSNRDGKLSQDELKARIARYDQGAAGGGPVAAACQVTLDGKPLEGATIRFIPEPFMADVLMPASGTTDASGHCNLKMDGQDAFMMLPGLYKITVTRKDGKPLPARYNDKTTLGREVFEGGRAASGSIDLYLQSN